MDETGDDSQWINVQEPVRQMISAITKAVRTQSAGIRDLDRKIGHLVPQDRAERMIEGALAVCCTKQEAMQMMDMLRNKSDADQVANLESTSAQISRQMTRLNEVLQGQNEAIRDINTRVTSLSQEVESLQSMNYDKIYSYIDRQFASFASDITNKLAVKADLREVERVSQLPKHLDEMLQRLQGQINDVVRDVNSSASKDDIYHLQHSKADAIDLRSLTTALQEKTAKSDTQQLIVQHMQPLVTTITALEKVVAMTQQQPAAKQHWTYDKIQNVVDDTLRSRHLGEVSDVQLETSIAEMRELVMREMAAQTESVRAEAADTARELVHATKKQLEVKIQETTRQTHDAREDAAKAKSGLKDLASNVAKALAKKADKNDLRRSVREHLQQEQQNAFGEHTSIYGTASLASQMRQSAANLKSSDVDDGAEKLRREMRAVKKDVERVLSAHEDVRREIDTFKRAVHDDYRDLKSQLEFRGSSSSSDWRVGLGEMAISLRREIADKCSREEMMLTRSEVDEAIKQYNELRSLLQRKCEAEEVSKLDNDFQQLKSKVSSELTGARWLWTSGRVAKGGWLPWDAEVVNAAPALFLWRQGASSITTRAPGLYRLCVAVFTTLPSVLQVCLNGEPMLSLQPDLTDTTTSNSQALKEDKYVMRRLRHSVGEVTCLSIDEHVSLPADSLIAVRFESAAPAQAFLSLKKL